MQRLSQMYRRVVLGDVVDDSRNVTVASLAYPLIVITNIDAPVSARPGEPIDIRVDWTNTGGDGTMFFMYTNLDTGHSERSAFKVLAGTSSSNSLALTMGAIDLRILIEMGHTEL